MSLLKLIVLACGCLLFSACVNVEAEVKESLIKELAKSNPQIPVNSVKYGQFTQIGKTQACLEVNIPNHPKANSKGDLEAYALYRSNDNKVDKKGWAVYDFHDESHEKCVKFWNFVAKRNLENTNGTDYTACKAAVLKVLKDPDSAKFGAFKADLHTASLAVNARNAMGGYAGEQTVTLHFDSDTDVWSVEKFDP